MSDINITISGKKRLLTAGKYCDKNIVITPVGGGDFSGEYVIPVDELPTENIDTNALYLCKGAYYKYQQTFADIVVNNSSITFSLGKVYESEGLLVGFYIIPTKTTEGILPSTDTAVHFYYIENENDVFLYEEAEGELVSVATSMFDGIPHSGFITDASEATAVGWYLLGGSGWTKYLAPTGTLEITESGTYDVSEYASAEVNVQGGAVQEYDGTITIS